MNKIIIPPMTEEQLRTIHEWTKNQEEGREISVVHNHIETIDRAIEMFLAFDLDYGDNNSIDIRPMLRSLVCLKDDLKPFA